MVLAEVAIDLTESGWSNSEYRPPLPHGDGARKAWLFQEEEEVNLIKSVSILVVMIVDADTATARGGGINTARPACHGGMDGDVIWTAWRVKKVRKWLKGQEKRRNGQGSLHFRSSRSMPITGLPTVAYRYLGIEESTSFATVDRFELCRTRKFPAASLLTPNIFCEFLSSRQRCPPHEHPHEDSPSRPSKA